MLERTEGTQTLKPKSIGLIGAGRRGRLAHLAHRPDEGSRLTAVCDVDAARLKPWREKYGPDLFVSSDYRELLSAPDLDAVIICSPDWLHELHAVEALRAGKSVYLEKPLAISMEGCRHIMQAAKETGRLLYLGHNMRFMPVMCKMREIIKSGRIGEVRAIWCRHFISYGGDAYFRDWHAEQRYVNGLLLQKAAHDIDMIHWFSGSYAKRVVGFGSLSVYNRCERRDEKAEAMTTWDRSHWPPLQQTGFNPTIDVEDHSMILLDLKNGVQASYMQCHYAPDDQRNYTVIGSEGRLENCGDHSTDSHWASVRIWDKRCGYLENGTESIAIPPIDGTHGGADPLIMDDFLTALHGQVGTGATSEDAFMAVAAAIQGTVSLRNGGAPQEVLGWEAHPKAD